MAPRIVNFGEWSGHLLARLRREAAISGDPGLEALHAEVSADPGVESEAAPGGGTGVFVPLRLREGDRELAFISTLSTFGSAVEITVAELAIEAFYPANAETAMRLPSEVDGAPPAG